MQKIIGGWFTVFLIQKRWQGNSLDMGFYIGIGGVVTFKKCKDIKGSCSLSTVRQNRIREDCPYLSPEPNRGKRNSSLNLNYCSMKRSVRSKGSKQGELIAVTEENARQLYRMKEV